VTIGQKWRVLCVWGVAPGWGGRSVGYAGYSLLIF